VVVGVDLSPGRIKVVALAAGADGPELIGAVDEATPETADRRFDVAKVSARLRKALDTIGVSPREVALALGPADALVRRIAVVPQPREATLAALALQLAPALGPDVSAPRVDYATLRAPASGGRVSVLAAAGRSDAIAAQRQAVAEAGFDPGPVVPTASALACAWLALAPGGSSDRALLLHVGESAVLWMVIEDGEPLALDAPLVGVASLRDRPGVRRGAAGAPVEAAPEAIAEWVARIRQEVQRGLQAARRETGQDAVAAVTVWLCGGGARIPGLADALSGALGAAVHVFDPAPALGGLPGDGFGPALVPAIGAAMQALSRDPELGLDLRPHAGSDARGAARVPLAVLGRRLAHDGAFRFAALVAVVGGLVAWTAGARQDGAATRLARRESQADSAQVAAAIAQNQALATRRSELGAAVEQLLVLERGRDLWPRILDGIAAAVPATAWVSGVSEEREDPATGTTLLRLRGFAASDVVASSFDRRLATTAPYIAAGGAQTTAVRIGSITAVQFELTAEARNESAGGAP